MAGGACKVVICSWNEINELPAGSHALETALRHMCSGSTYAHAIGDLQRTDRQTFDRAIAILGQLQMSTRDQEWLRELCNKLAET